MHRFIPILILSCSVAQAQTRDSSAVAEMEGLMDFITQQSARINQLQADYRALRSARRGEIAAFDLDACPTALGWRPIPELQGRVIVGAGQPLGNPNRDEHDRELTPRTLHASGGEEIHLLSPAEMPRHSHSYEDVFHSEDEHLRPSGTRYVRVPGKAGASTRPDPNNSGWLRPNTRTGTMGENAAHNNMPPFFALTYCRFTGDDG